jgi:anhydro-N-acetylmuramic acid kinase
MLRELYIGLMSGTSLDGIDGVLVCLHQTGQWDRVYSHIHHPFAQELRDDLLALQSSGADELHRAAMAANRLALAYAAVCADLLQAAEVSPAEVRAVGAHGQTVRHQPGAHDGTGYTLQILQPALLAERCGMPVVADFRSRDVAAGGQGAPLVPPFHQTVFGRMDAVRVVANIGGMTNLTVLSPARPVIGFDCGPGNALLDAWCAQQTGKPFDEAGAWAATGQVLPLLLTQLQAEPFLQLPPPKSTGRDLFNTGWLHSQLNQFTAGHTEPAPRDVQATLSEFTAGLITDHVRRHAPQANDLLVCGGGALNLDLMNRLQAHSPALLVNSTATYGLPPLQVEAAAFAWLARMHVHGEPAGLPAVTGANGPRVLGALYPA